MNWSISATIISSRQRNLKYRAKRSQMRSKTTRWLSLTQTTFCLELIQIKKATKCPMSSCIGSPTRLSWSSLVGSQFIKATTVVERKRQSKMRLFREIKSSLKRNVQLIIIKINRCTILVKTFNYKVQRQHLWEEKLQMLISNSGCSSLNPRLL